MVNHPFDLDLPRSSLDLPRPFLPVMAALLMGAQLVSGYMLSTPAGVQQHRHAEPVMAATKVSRRKAALDTQVDREKLYEPEEAISIIKKTSTAKFTETIELHANLNLDPKYNDQQIRTTVSLPAGTGKTVRVAVLAEGPAADAATAAGADIVGMADLIEVISSGVTDFDVLLATPPAMPKLAKLGKVLGPKVRPHPARRHPARRRLRARSPSPRRPAHPDRPWQGLMPSPKAGTVSADPASSVAEFKVCGARSAPRPGQSATRGCHMGHPQGRLGSGTGVARRG